MVTIGRKVATVGEHDVVGERGILLDTVRAATVTAMEHMITYAISRQRLRALVGNILPYWDGCWRTACGIRS